MAKRIFLLVLAGCLVLSGVIGTVDAQQEDINVGNIKANHIEAKDVVITNALVKGLMNAKNLAVTTEQGIALIASGIGDNATAIKIMHMSNKKPAFDLVSNSPLAAAKFLNENTSGSAIEASGKSTKTIAKFVNNDTTYVDKAHVENHALYAESKGKGATVLITNTSPKGTSLEVFGNAPTPTAFFINKNTSGVAGYFHGNVKVIGGCIHTGQTPPQVTFEYKEKNKTYTHTYTAGNNDIASAKDLLAKGDLIVGGSARINDDIKVSGVKNAVIKTASYGTRLTYADESTEVFLFDRGRGQLKNGEVTIDLEPIFLETITVNDEYPITVYLTPTGECRGLYVSQTTASSFTVKELCNGKSNATFDWEVGAKRKGYEEERLAQWMGSNERTALLTVEK